MFLFISNFVARRPRLAVHRAFLLLSVIALSGAASAQVIFQDSFEYTDPDPHYMYNRGGWAYTQGSLRPEEGEGPSFPVGPTDGIQPKTGNKMFDLRASTFALQERELYHGVSQITTAPVTECSVAFCYRPIVSYPLELSIKCFAGGAGYLAIINESRTQIKLEGTGQTRFKDVAVSAGQWHTFTYRIEWVTKQLVCKLDNQTVFSRTFGGSTAIRSISSYYVALTPRSSTGNVYDVFTGAPGVFIDDYRVIGVPELSSLWPLTLLVSGFGLHLNTRRRASARASS